LLDLTARRYSQRPSSLIGIDDPWEALCIDVVCADAGRAYQEHAIGRAASKGNGLIPGVVPVVMLGSL